MDRRVLTFDCCLSLAGDLSTSISTSLPPLWIRDVSPNRLWQAGGGASCARCCCTTLCSLVTPDLEPRCQLFCHLDSIVRAQEKRAIIYKVGVEN